MRVPAEATALEQERVRVEVLRAPLFTRCGEIGILRVWAGTGAGGVVARDRGSEQCEAGKSDWIHVRTTGRAWTGVTRPNFRYDSAIVGPATVKTGGPNRENDYVGIVQNRESYGVADGRLERLTTDVHSTNDPVRWSPNGSYIAVQSTEGGNYDIQIVPVADHDRRIVAGSPSYDGQFTWSPASNQLTFISGRDGFDAVYVTDLSGKEQRRLTTTSSLDPRWSP
jgi:hypothetical protein